MREKSIAFLNNKNCENKNLKKYIFLNLLSQYRENSKAMFPIVGL